MTAARGAPAEGLLRHWYPVRPSRELTHRPLGVRVAGVDLVLFRDAEGRPAALAERCPHRGARLSCGHVDGGRVVCPYHAWRFDRNGAGIAPAQPALKASARAFEAVDHVGLVWLRAADRGPAPGPLPTLSVEGLRPLGVFRRTMAAGLEAVVDNFSEIEHTPGVHALGYADPERMEFTVTVDAEGVRGWGRGPPGRLSRWIARGARLPSGAWFEVAWLTTASPPCTRFEHRWVVPATGEAHPEGTRVWVWYTPVDEATTDVHVSAWTSASPRGRWGLNRLLEPLHLRLVAHEIDQDARVLRTLVDPAGGLEGARLGRFDAAVVETRRLLRDAWRGAP